MTIKDYRVASLEFRRIASNMLMTDADTANVQLIRFKQYIDSNPIINRILNGKISEVEYDFRQCFLIENSGWKQINPPVDEASHLKAQYDYISYLCSNEMNIRNVAYGYHHRSSSWNQIVRDFLDDAFKPLVDFITDSLSKEIMFLEEEKPIGNFTQNIHTNYGTVNSAGRDIESFNSAAINDIGEIKALIEKILPSISKSPLTAQEKEDLTDDLEILSEQIQSNEPKVSRIRKVYENIKRFVSIASKGIEATGILLVDWHNLLSKLDAFISKIK